MIEKDWRRKISEFFDGIGLTDEIIENMKLLEWLVEDGKARVITCIERAGSRGMRYSELEKITGIPRTNLIRILNDLKNRKHEIVIQKFIDVTEPRKERVPVYFYNKKKFGFSIENLVTRLMVISRDTIEVFKERMGGE